MSESPCPSPAWSDINSQGTKKSTVKTQPDISSRNMQIDATIAPTKTLPTSIPITISEVSGGRHYEPGTAEWLQVYWKFREMLLGKMN